MSSTSVTTSVWYRWTAPTSGTVVVDTCDITGITSPADTVVSVFTGNSVGSLTHVISNDDDANHCGRVPPDFQSSVSFTAAGASVYAFRVANFTNGMTSTPGAFRLRIRTIPYPQAAPTASGTAKVGSILSSTNGTWQGGQPITATRTWQRCTDPMLTSNCSPISGQNGAKYTPTADDLGKWIRASESATNSIGASTRTAFSDPVGPVTAAAPITNDNFVNAIDLGNLTSFSVTGHNVGATTELNEVLPLFNATNSVWYRWVAPATAIYRFSLCDATSFDSFLTIYTGGSASTVTQVESDDDGCSDAAGGSEITVSLTAGTSYALQIAGYSGASGSFTLAMATRPYLATKPSISGSFLLGDGSISRTAATWNGTAPFTIDGHWYRCSDKTSTIGCSQTATAGSSYVTDMNDLGKYIRFGETAGNLAGTSPTSYSDPIGPIHVLSVPPNDLFANPEELPGIPNPTSTGGNIDAGASLDDPSVSGINAKTLWYKWTSPFTGQAKIGTCGADFNSVLGIYTGTAASLTPVATADDGCNDMLGASQLTANVTAGTTYRIMVGGFRAPDFGTFTLKIENVTPPAPPASSGGSGGGGAGGGSVPAADPVKFVLPTLKANKLKAKIKKSAITIPRATLACAASATGPCTGTAKLTVTIGSKKVKLSIKLSFKAGSNGAIVLPLSKSAAKKLAGAKKSPATVVVSVNAPGFSAKSATVKFTLG
jgi:hypothetical protein